MYHFVDWLTLNSCHQRIWLVARGRNGCLLLIKCSIRTIFRTSIIYICCLVFQWVELEKLWRWWDMWQHISSIWGISFGRTILAQDIWCFIFKNYLCVSMIIDPVWLSLRNLFMMHSKRIGYLSFFMMTLSLKPIWCIWSRQFKSIFLILITKFIAVSLRWNKYYH